LVGGNSGSGVGRVVGSEGVDGTVVCVGDGTVGDAKGNEEGGDSCHY